MAEEHDKIQTSVDVTAGKQRGSANAGWSDLARLWWMAFPVFGLCFLISCVAATATAVWPVRSSKVPAEPIAVSAEATLPRAEASQILTTTPMSQPAKADTPVAVPSVAGDSLAELLPPKPLNLPEICKQTPVVASPVISGPVFSPISFSTRQDSIGWPLDTRLQFTTAISQIQASFGFAGMTNGQTWERVWYFGDEEIFRGSSTWTAGERGQLSVYSRVAEAGFVPGRYRLEIQINGRPMAQGEFLLVEEHTPTYRPVDVALTSWDGEQHRIELVSLDSGQAEPLLEFARSPAWSADATGLLFVGEAGIAEGDPGLWVFNTSQQKSYQLNHQTDYDLLAWAPHRAYLATTATKADGPRIALQRLDDGQMFFGPPGAQPAWSPEGRRLAYRGCNAAGWSINTVEVIDNIFVGESIKAITAGDDSQPAWSTDGQTIAFVRHEDDTQEIYSVAFDGSSPPRRLTNDAWPDAGPVWLPDGRILYQSLRDGAWVLIVMAADGRNSEELLATEAPAEWQPERPAVSPDYVLIEPTPQPPPKPRVQVPAGMGILVVSNLQNNDEMTFTIDNTEHKIPPYQYRTIPFAPGHYTWTASWPAKVSRTGIADIALGQVSYPVVER